jgi:hypothetical protein
VKLFRMRIRRLEDHVVRGPSDSGVDGQALGPIFQKSRESAKNQTCMKMLVLGRFRGGSVRLY